MTAIEFLYGVVAIANTVLLSLILIELRNDRLPRLLRDSQRRQWTREEHES